MDRVSGEPGGYGEQKYNEQTSLPAYYGGGQPLVDRSHQPYNPERAQDHYNQSDVYRGMLGDVDTQQKQMSAFQFPEATYAASGKTWGDGGAAGGKPFEGAGDTYHGGIVRSDDTGTQRRNNWASASLGHLDGPVETEPGLTRLQHNKKYPIQMASADQFRQRAGDDVFFMNEDVDDESSEGGMMMEDESMGNDGAPGGLCAPPEYYRQDSTLKSIVDGSKTVDAIQRALDCKPRSVDYTKNSSSQFEGQCCEAGRCCDFMINTYQEIGNDTRQQICVEFRNLSSGINSKQAFAVFFKDMVETLKHWSIVTGLVNPDFQMPTSLQEETGGEDNSSPVADEEVRRVIKDRVRELKQASFLGKQRALSEEILFIAERHATLVAESLELAPVLLDILGKNAKSDTQLSRTINRLVRALLAYDRFEQILKEADCCEGKPGRAIKILLQTADATKVNRAWKADLFDTVQTLQKVGFQCAGKKANAAYSRIQHVINLQ